MSWDHEETTLNGTAIYKPGTLVRIDLSQHMLIASEKPIIKYNDWLETSRFIKEYGSATPIVMVIDLDPLEMYYRVSLGERNYWFPLKFTSKAS